MAGQRRGASAPQPEPKQTENVPTPQKAGQRRGASAPQPEPPAGDGMTVALARPAETQEALKPVTIQDLVVTPLFLLEDKQPFVPMNLPSRGIDTIEILDRPGRPRVVEGSINGHPFQVPCDRQVYVHPAVREALSGLIDKQRG